MAESVGPFKKSTKSESARYKAADLLELLELPCAILCFSVEGDYQRNIYMPNVRISKQEEQTCDQSILLSTDRR